MRIITGLSYEKNGGYSLALFGKPRINFQRKAGHIIYVDCHIIAVDPNTSSVFRNIDSESLIDSGFLVPTTTESKMRSAARKLAKNYVKSHCWNIGRGSEYIQNRQWHGFYFKVI